MFLVRLIVVVVINVFYKNHDEQKNERKKINSGLLKNRDARVRFL